MIKTLFPLVLISSYPNTSTVEMTLEDKFLLTLILSFRPSQGVHSLNPNF